MGGLPIEIKKRICIIYNYTKEETFPLRDSDVLKSYKRKGMEEMEYEEGRDLKEGDSEPLP